MPKKCITPEEYLAQEEKAECKSEYRRGEIIPAVSESINHNQILGNLIAQIVTNSKNSQFEVFMSQIKLWIEEQQVFTYPDIIVTTQKLELYPERDDTITNPTIIIKATSDSTKY